MDVKIRTYRLPEVLQNDIPLSNRYHAHLDMIMFHRAILTLLIHGGVSIVTHARLMVISYLQPCCACIEHTYSGQRSRIPIMHLKALSQHP
jgi:hypothetical protein